MRRYGYIQALYLSFFSRDFYRDVVDDWHGSVIVYMLILLGFCWAFLAVGMQEGINAGYHNFASRYLLQVPHMQFVSGELKTPEQRPYIIEDFSTKPPTIFAVIDTTNKMNDINQTGATMLINKNSMVYHDHNTLRTQVYSKNMDLIIDPVFIREKGEKFVKWLSLIFFPFLVIFSLLYRVIEAAIYSLLGKFYANIYNYDLSYGEIFKISLFALTPAIILSTVFAWVPFYMPMELVLYFLITSCYIIFGIRANRNHHKTKDKL